MINVKEIQEIENKRKKIKKEIYTKIYEQFCKKIRTSVEMGAKYTELAVPNFLIGYPTFDQNQASMYLKRQLINAGFNVKQMSPTEFKVSWSSAKKSSAKPQEPEHDAGALPSLINIRKLASKHKGA